jgi:hypothetical protein
MYYVSPWIPFLEQKSSEPSDGRANARNTGHCRWAATLTLPGYSYASMACDRVHNQEINTCIDRVVANLNDRDLPEVTSLAHSWANHRGLWYPRNRAMGSGWVTDRPQNVKNNWRITLCYVYLRYYK